MRENAHRVEIGIRGSGRISVQGRDVREIDLARLDVANIPAMQGFVFRNTGDEVWARLSYSNAPLLEKLTAHYAEDLPEGWEPRRRTAGPRSTEAPAAYTRGTAPDHAIGTDGARLRGYEFLVDIEVVESLALHWPWEEVRRLLSRTAGDGGRTIMALYNPATRRRQGATHNFFVTASYLPPGSGQRPAGAATSTPPSRSTTTSPATARARSTARPSRGRRATCCSPHRPGSSTRTTRAPRAWAPSPCRTTRCTSAWSRWCGRRRWTAPC
ncbi:hypothetical protein ACFQV8_31120 [Pseudonocardia benzenivorans]